MGSPMAANPAIPSDAPSALSTFDENRESLRRLLSGARDTDSEASKHSHRACSLRRAYERSGGNEAVLEEAIAAARQAVEHTSTRNKYYRPARLSDLSRLLQMLYEHRTAQNRSDGLHIGEEAIETASQAAHYTPDGDWSGNRAARFSRLAHLLLEMRFRMTRDLEDLDKAIDAARAAVNATPQGHVHEAARLGLLAQVLEARFKHEHDARDLREAVEVAKRALEGEDVRRESTLSSYRRQHQHHVGPPPPRGHAGRLGHLAAMYSSLWMLERNPADAHLLDEAVQYGRAAEALTPQDNPRKASRLRNLSMMLARRYEAQGSNAKPVDLNEAVTLALESVARTSPDDKHKLGSRLANLARVQLMRYQHLEVDADLESARGNAESALGFPGTRWSRCCTLNILATICSLRFQSSLDSEHLEDAIKFAQRAVAEVPASGILSNLVSALEMGFKRFRNQDFLDEALSHAEEALRLSASVQYSDSDRAARHCDLASVLETRARNIAGASGDMAKALQHALDAVQLTQPSDPHRLRRLSVFGSTVAGIRQQAPGAPVPALGQVIGAVQETVRSGAVTGPYLGALQNNLGRMFEISGAPDKARAVYEEVAASSSSPPLMRILALRRAGILHADRGAWPKALEMFREAISLLSNGDILRSLRLDDHEHTLSQLSGLAPLSSEAALKAHESHREALVWSERGRGVIGKLAVNTPLHLIPDAQSHNKPDVGSSISLRRRLRNPGSRWRNWTGKSAREPPASTRVGGILADVETQLTDANLRKLAEAGPIVSYNATRYGSGAFIITMDHGVWFEPLPGLRYDELEQKARLLNDIKNSTQHRIEANNTLQNKILPWLWEIAVEPVLEYLGFTGGKVDGRLPRIWWVSSGLLGSFPLHAAGTDWREQSKESTLRRAVSSYVPSVMGLLLARAARPPEWSAHLLAPGKRLLFIAVPQPVGGKMDRLKVEDELKALRDGVGGSLDVRQLPDPAKATVLDLLARDESPVVHFACHGTSEQEKPSKSALLLKNERLTAGELMTMNRAPERPRLVRAELAYMSACSMAKNGSPDLVDEAIHLASALFLVGFPNVVGPLWEALDKSAPRVTGAFYKHLANTLDAERSKRKPDKTVLQRAVADAIHEATVERLQSPLTRRDLADWASFVHIGV